MEDSSHGFLGKGLQFPFTFQKRSGGTQISTATSRDHAHIHESIRQILGTRLGERFLRPDFGTRLHELVFEPNDSVLYGLIRHEVTDALGRWEPRVVITDVLVGQSATDEHLVLADIHYRLISSQVSGNMVFPFYRELE
jgi:phage baseplate assembly protein W